MELLNAGDSHILQAASFTLLDDSSVGLTCAKDNTVNFFVRTNVTRLVGWVGNDPFKVRLASELLDARAGHGVSKERFGEEEDEGFAELAVHLSAKDMEHVGRLRQIRNLHVAVLMLAVKLVGRWEDAWVFIAELEVALHTSGGVLGTLSIVTVRQA